MAGFIKALNTFKGVITGTHHRTQNELPLHSMSQSVMTASDEKPKHEQLDTSNMAKILIIGETGSGKSTFINYLTNYFRKGSLQNVKIAIPSKFRPQVTESFGHCEHDIENTTQSKTDGCYQYMFTQDSKHYVFLDTPGLSDTRGTEQDNINISKIIDSVESLGGLTAVIIVVNGAVARLTVNLQNVIIRLRGNLPDIVMDNVIVVLTNSTRYVANFSVKVLELNGNVYPYYLQNSAFSTDPSTWNAAALEALLYDWNQAMDELNAMMKTLDTFKTKSVTAFKNMKDIRNEIKTLMHSAQLEVTQIQQMQDEIAAFDTALKQANSDLVTYKDYTKERTVENIELVDAPFHSTLCQNCNHVCHEKCALNETTTVGAQIFQNCWAMSKGNCTQCPNKCSYTAHYHAKKTVRKINKKINDVLTEIKTKYDKASNDQASYNQKITTIADAKKLLEKALKQKNDDIINLCKKLRAICSGFNLAQELHALINQLEMQASMLRNIDAKQQATVFIRSLKAFCETLEKDQATGMTLPRMNIIDTDRSVSGPAHTPRPEPTSSSMSLSRSDAKDGTASVSPPDPDSHANEGVLAAIRALNDKKSRLKKGKVKKKVTDKTIKPTDTATESSDDSIEEEEKEESTTDDKSESEIENNKNDRKKARKKKKESKPTATEATAEQFKELTIDELLTHYRACKDQRLANFIVHELTLRSYGKSTGPLETPMSIADFMSSMQKYGGHNSVELRHDYEKLKDRVTAITEPDILKIDQVPLNLLLEIAAVYTLVQRTPLEMSPPPSDFNTQRDNQYAGQHWHQPYAFPAPNYNSPQHCHQAFASRLPFDSFSSKTGPSGAYQYSSGFHHPSMNAEQPPHLEARPDSHRYYFPESTSHGHYPRYAFHPQETYSHGAHNELMVDPSLYDVQQSAFRPIDHPIPVRLGFVSPSQLTNSLRDMSLLKSSATGDEHRHNLSPSGNRQCSSTASTSVSENLDCSSSYTASSSSCGPKTSVMGDDNTSEVRNMTDTQLLSAHYDAFAQHNHARCNVVYNELKRRCSGDHPILIREKQALFEQKLSEYQGRSHVELQQAQTNILSRIQQHLTGDDATHLKEIPPELIVEAAVLAHCIGYKSL